MADSSFPFSSGPGSTVTDDGWSQMGSLWAPDGVVAEAPRVTLGSGLTFTIPDGFAGRVSGFHYRNNGVQTKTALNNTSSQARRDRLVLRLDRNAKTITPTILQGAPGSGTPPLPALTRDNTVYDEPVCYATCPGSGSSQNYSGVVHEFRGVSSKRGKHAWTFGGSIGAGNTQFTGLSQGYSDGIATLINNKSIKLGRPGIWSLALKTYSDSPSTGLSSVWMDWVGGPDLYSDMRDDRWRGNGFAGAGQLRQRITWTGVVPPTEADQLINLFAFWNTLGSVTTYTGEFYAHYLGG